MRCEVECMYLGTRFFIECVARDYAEAKRYALIQNPNAIVLSARWPLNDTTKGSSRSQPQFQNINNNNNHYRPVDNPRSAAEGFKFFVFLASLIPLCLFVIGSYLTFGIAYVFSSPYKRTLHKQKFDAFKKDARDWIGKAFKWLQY